MNEQQLSIEQAKQFLVHGETAVIAPAAQVVEASPEPDELPAASDSKELLDEIRNELLSLLTQLRTEPAASANESVR